MAEVIEISGSEADYRFAVDECGAVVIMRCIAHGGRVCVPETLGGGRVVELGEGSFASSERMGLSMSVFNAQLESVSLPEGLLRIGRAAFRGCGKLARVTLPESLEVIDDLAFSRTAVTTLRLPHACTRLSELALRTGPESLHGPASPYYSSLDTIEVDSRNGVYRMHGEVLCKRIAGGGLEATLCPGKAREIVLDSAVERVASTAFAGTYEVGKLVVFEGVSFEDGCGFGSNAVCSDFAIELEQPFRGSQRLWLAMPSRELQRAVLDAARGRARFDKEAFLAAYDDAVAREGDLLLQAKLMANRLARPLGLTPKARDVFTCTLEPIFDALCVHFGARNYWRGFEDLADAGLLDAGNIAHAVDVLTRRADTVAAGYLLELRRTRFEGGGWDYGI